MAQDDIINLTKTNTMAEFKIRFNTEHNGSDLKWRAIIDGDEQKVKNVIINCPSKTTEDWITSPDNTQFLKHHISCTSKKWNISEDKVLTIN